MKAGKRCFNQLKFDLFQLSLENSFGLANVRSFAFEFHLDEDMK